MLTESLNLFAPGMCFSVFYIFFSSNARKSINFATNAYQSCRVVDWSMRKRRSAEFVLRGVSSLNAIVSVSDT